MKHFARTGRRLITTFGTTLVVAGLATAWAVSSPLTAPCAQAVSLSEILPAGTENAAFLTAINTLRIAKGLNPLVVDANLTSVAQQWAQQMAQDNGISHRSDLRAGITSPWKSLGENVGVGPAVPELMAAFIASPGHYRNLVDPGFTHVGVGSVRTSGGLLYTAHEFMTLASAPPVTIPPTPAPTAPKVTAPKVTVPKVTAPPATTPPTTVPPPPEPTPLEATVTPLPVEDEGNELHKGSQDDQQEKQDQSNSRCRAHSDRTLALSFAGLTRSA